MEQIISDAEARIVIAGQELLAQLRPLVDCGDIAHVIAVRYCDYLHADTDLDLPDVVTAQRDIPEHDIIVDMTKAIAQDCPPPTHSRRPQDWCLIAYSSGTTGKPKGCLHTHASVNATTQFNPPWTGLNEGLRILSTLPLYHVAGMPNSMNATLCAGATIVIFDALEPGNGGSADPGLRH